MASWVIKAAAQRAIGVLPWPHYWNGLLQERVSGTVILDETRFVDKLARARGHLRAYAARAGETPPGRVVEIGTGWFPVVPLALWLRGAGEVHSFDLADHLDDARLAATLARFAEFRRDGRLDALLPGIDPERASRLDSLARAGAAPGLLRAMEAHGFRYRVGPLATASLPTGSADFVFSTAVLEYLPYGALVALLREEARLLADDGCDSHWIDMGDEYAYFDTGITPFNFLRFPGWAWRLINNPIIPLSRLRIDDYRRAFAAAGLRIVTEEPRRGAATDLARVPLAPEFSGRPREDLLVLDAWVSCVRTRSRGANPPGPAPSMWTGDPVARLAALGAAARRTTLPQPVNRP